MITVRWRHLLLDPDVFSAAGTWRVARALRAGGVFPSPTGWRTWSDAGMEWVPREASQGYAPHRYRIPRPTPDDPDAVRLFYFHFWGIKLTETTRQFMQPRSDPQRIPRVAFQATTPLSISLEATAYYEWDWASGPGSHAVRLDMYDEVVADYVEPDFVDVVPDDKAARPLTTSANNGLLLTDEIEDVVVTARDPAPGAVSSPYAQYRFNQWHPIDGLTQAGPAGRPPPSISDDGSGPDISVHRTNIMVATAWYSRIQKDIPQVRVPGEVFHILSGLAGGTTVIIAPGLVYDTRPPGGLPPDETYRGGLLG